MRDADADEIAEAIAHGGLGQVKAPRIKAILAALSERTGRPDLSELDGMSDRAALAYLQSLPGVGAQDGRLRAAVLARPARRCRWTRTCTAWPAGWASSTAA